MKKLIPLLLVASLGGCETLTNVTGDLATVVAEVKTITSELCRYLPSDTTVVDILSGGTLTQAEAIAKAICAAVATPAVRRGGELPQVNGVVIRGHRI
jgi:hypothetical protein